MEVIKNKVGRPEKSDSSKKKSRPLSFTDAEYNKLLSLAKKEGAGPSAFIIQKLGLDQ